MYVYYALCVVVVPGTFVGGESDPSALPHDRLLSSSATRRHYPGMALAEPLAPLEGHVLHTLQPGKRRALIIDTDAGIDDAQALILALTSEEVHVLAVTSTHGNVALGHVEGNVCACLHAAGRRDVPLYLGAEAPLVHSADEDASEWHGADGLGNTRLGTAAPRECIVPGVPACVAIHTLAARYLEEHGEVLDIVTLGPLTNLALSLRSFPRLPSLVGTVFVMGGAERGHGNVGFPSLTAEYNVFADPEAAAVVFASFPRIVQSSWELTLKCGLRQPFLAEYLSPGVTPLGTFLADVTQHLLTATGEAYIEAKGLMIPDPLAMAIAIRPSLVLASERHAVFVETRGQYTRGQTVTDWRDVSGKARNVEIVHEVDFAAVQDMLLASVRGKGVSG